MLSVRSIYFRLAADCDFIHSLSLFLCPYWMCESGWLIVLNASKFKWIMCAVAAAAAAVV